MGLSPMLARIVVLLALLAAVTIGSATAAASPRSGVSPQTLPNAVVGVAYRATVTGTDASGVPLVFTGCLQGPPGAPHALPTGLGCSMTSGGETLVVAGKADGPGTFDFYATAYPKNSNAAPGSGEQSYKLKITVEKGKPAGADLRLSVTFPFIKSSTTTIGWDSKLRRSDRIIEDVQVQNTGPDASRAVDLAATAESTGGVELEPRGGVFVELNDVAEHRLSSACARTTSSGALTVHCLLPALKGHERMSREPWNLVAAVPV